MSQHQQLATNREVASGLINLGNTCYANAILQSLAHAPELCLAIELAPHLRICRHNITAREKATQQQQQEDNIDNNNGSDGMNNKDEQKQKQQIIQDETEEEEEEEEVCVLCEVEKHLMRVHAHAASSVNDTNTATRMMLTDDNTSTAVHTNNTTTTTLLSNKQAAVAVAPNTLLDQCLPKLAPVGTFRKGLQEDSHEFLRLLIDGMQRSCAPVATKTAVTGDNNDVGGSDGVDANATSESSSSSLSDSSAYMYPFQLFRGTIQSTVKCSNPECQKVSSTMDPMEDVGLEVSDNTNADSVSGALEAFIREEKLEGYKCEHCGCVGQATKVNKLAKVPPILTLHLKRFRYGASSSISGMASNKRNSERSGKFKSGSAKIEGHIKFEEVFNIRNYLCSKLQDQHRTMFCRLFAVVVHTGKNSHSGHYFAYVRNLVKNEWWKMDDATVIPVSKDEVLDAEAYMLFYNVLNHPLSVQLKADQAQLALREKNSQQQQQQQKEKQLFKRPRPVFENGEAWARKRTKIPLSTFPVLAKISDWIGEHAEFNHAYFSQMQGEAAVFDEKNNNSSKSNMDPAPSGVGAQDLKEVGGRTFKKLLYDALSAILSHHKDADFLLPSELSSSDAATDNVIQSAHPVIDTNDSSVV
mmetsp:Transcript_25004/g.37403  ORF Transcript_25004/g.37403 Transcript_25004/m.37403 type:complete len:641 (-) Transcript_25004:86-2008(-)